MDIATDTTRISRTPDSSTSARWGLPRWQAIVAGAAGAVVLNLAVYLVATAAGASLVLAQPTGPHVVTAGGVAFSSLVPLLPATAVAVLLSLWKAWFLRLAQVIGTGLGLLSIAGPLLADTDGGTRIALASMHFVVAAAVFTGLELAHRAATR
ncbi:MAG: DUF6069 family protein [Micromonosporaceae bacterium]